jgi:REP element-mobilizing transposase RayT
MARALRIEYEGAFYHVTTRGNERKKIFFAKSDYQRFKSYLEEALEKYGYYLHSYVLMPNHYHLIIETPKGNLSKLMHYINGSYTNYINRRKGRSGHLFQGRYKAILVDQDNYLLELSRYVHLNPVRAGMVERPKDYPYSSYRSFIYQKKAEEMVKRDLIWGMISTAPEKAAGQYRVFVEKAIDEGLESPFKNVYGGAVLGGKGFIREALARLKDDVLHREEVANRRELGAVFEAEEILSRVSMQVGVSIDDLTNAKGELRDTTIYLIKKYTGLTNRQIGEIFGGLTYSAVAKIYKRFSEKREKDRTLKKRLKKLTSQISNVKG